MSALILIIEDNGDNLDLMAYLLNAFGHRTIAARDGIQGLARARSGVDLIVCDIQLPGLDGLEIARRFRADPLVKPTPLVAVTAFAMVGDEERILAAGFDGYIPKPIDPEAFVPQLEQHLPPGLRRFAMLTEGIVDLSHAPADAGLQSARVLLVDDGSDDLHILRRLLDPIGCRVVTASFSPSPSDLPASPTPDVIVLSLRDEAAAAEEWLDQLAHVAGLRHVPVILVTSTPDETAGLAVRRSDRPLRYVSGPVEPALLIGEIENCLRAR